jgi:hypothetical protein
MREVTPSEQEEYMKDHLHDTDDKYSRLRKQLRSIRGPVRFDDLVNSDDAQPPSTEDAPAEEQRRDEANLNPPNTTQVERSIDDLLRDIFDDQNNNVPPTNASVDTRQSASSSTTPTTPPRNTTQRSPSPRSTRNATKRTQPSEAIQRAAFESENAARILDGLPPREKRRRFEEQQINLESLDEDGDEVMMLEIDDAETEKEEEKDVVYVLKAADTIVEARLSKEEKKLFDKAKDEALAPWIQNEAWRRIKRDKTKKEETVPLRFLLRWNQTAAHQKVTKPTPE